MSLSTLSQVCLYTGVAPAKATDSLTLESVRTAIIYFAVGVALAATCTA